MDLALEDGREFLGDREAKPGAAVALRVTRVELAELLEDGFLVFLGDARAGVEHADADARAACSVADVFRADRDIAPLGRELDGVAEEVEDDLLELARVGLDEREHVVGGGPLERDTHADTVGLGADEPDEPVAGLEHIHLLDIDIDLARLDLRHLEQLVDHLEQRAARVHDVVEVAGPLHHAREFLGGLLLAGRFADRDGLEEFREADDRVERRAQFVADIGEEVALEFRGLVQRAVAPREFADAQVEGAIGRAQSLGGLGETLEHGVEGLAQFLVLVARRDGGARGEVARADPVGDIAQGAHRLEDDARGDEIEHQRREAHRERARDEQVHTVDEQLARGLGRAAFEEEHARERAGLVVAVGHRVAVDALGSVPERLGVLVDRCLAFLTEAFERDAQEIGLRRDRVEGCGGDILDARLVGAFLGPRLGRGCEGERAEARLLTGRAVPEPRDLA